MFGLVGTLQNVAVISSWQIMPVLGSGELFVVPPPLSACCGDCAATGDVAKSSAVINASFFMCALVLVVLSPTRRSRTLAAIGPSMFHHDAAMRPHSAPSTRLLTYAFALGEPGSVLRCPSGSPN